MTFSVQSFQDKEIYGAMVPSIDLTANADDIARAWEFHQAQSNLAIACLNDRIEPDQFLDGLYDVMGRRIDPYLDEIVIGLGVLLGHG